MLHTEGKFCKTGLGGDVKQNALIDKHRRIRFIKIFSVVVVAVFRNWKASFTIEITPLGPCSKHHASVALNPAGESKFLCGPISATPHFIPNHKSTVENNAE